jgi:hypothetical protein
MTAQSTALLVAYFLDLEGKLVTAESRMLISANRFTELYVQLRDQVCHRLGGGITVATSFFIVPGEVATISKLCRKTVDTPPWPLQSSGHLHSFLLVCNRNSTIATVFKRYGSQEGPVLIKVDMWFARADHAIERPIVGIGVSVDVIVTCGDVLAAQRMQLIIAPNWNYSNFCSALMDALEMDALEIDDLWRDVMEPIRLNGCILHGASYYTCFRHSSRILWD